MSFHEKAVDQLPPFCNQRRRLVQEGLKDGHGMEILPGKDRLLVLVDTYSTSPLKALAA